MELKNKEANINNQQINESLATNLMDLHNDQIHYMDENLEVRIKASKWLFVGLCFYIISQVYAIPLLPIGNWSLWPNLSDFAFCFMLGAFLFSKRRLLETSPCNRKIISILITAFIGSIISYVFYNINLAGQTALGISVGLYQIYRFIQFITLFWMTSHVSLNEKRKKILLKITDIVFLVVCLAIFLTFFNVLPLGTLTMHLPQDPDVAGVWSRYQSIGQYGGQGWGTTGYDHSHVAVNVIMLLALRIHLASSLNVLQDKVLLILGVVTCFFTESRTGLASILIYAILYWMKKPQYTQKVIAILGILIICLISYFSVVGTDSLHLASSEGSILDRQAGLTSIDSDSLSGRDEIWGERIALMTANPEILLWGSGFGAATDTGKKAHFLLLHITLETGLIGLSVFIWLFIHILYYLNRYEHDVKAIFLATICLFISSGGQDTIYFTVTFMHFTGFYLVTIAIALQNKYALSSNK